jgi:hypothetical protein
LNTICCVADERRMKYTTNLFERGSSRRNYFKNTVCKQRYTPVHGLTLRSVTAHSDGFYWSCRTIHSVVPRLTYNYHSTAAVATHHDQLGGGRMETSTAHDGSQGISSDCSENFALRVENLHASWMVHAAGTENIHGRMPLGLKGSQPAACERKRCS